MVSERWSGTAAQLTVLTVMLQAEYPAPCPQSSAYSSVARSAVPASVPASEIVYAVPSTREDGVVNVAVGATFVVVTVVVAVSAAPSGSLTIRRTAYVPSSAYALLGFAL